MGFSVFIKPFFQNRWELFHQVFPYEILASFISLVKINGSDNSLESIG